MKKLNVFLLALIITNVSYSEVVNCQINGIKSKTGNILVGIFNSPKGFEKRIAIKKIELSKQEVKNGVLLFSVNLPPGEYGFSILDDNNKSGEMEYNFFGIPKEGFGFSNYFHSGILSPRFEAFKFLLKKGKSKLIKIKMKYM
jgi:uncharacterized protein (DUF2141 family)